MSLLAAMTRRSTRPGAAFPGAAPDPVLQALEDEFAGWHVWRSAGGRLWATRTGPDADYGRDGIPMTLDADDKAGITRALAGVVQDLACSQGGECEPELNPDCQPPDYHCKKCKRYMGAA